MTFCWPPRSKRICGRCLGGSVECLERAIHTCDALKGALDQEIVRAQGERTLLRKFDVEGLLKRATLRGEFNAEILALEQTLARHLKDAGEQLGLPEVTLASLRGKEPEVTDRLSGTLDEIRALAGALSELDTLNKRLAQRATTYVRGYLNAVMPAPSLYDRHGAAPALVGSTFSGSA